MKRQRRLRTRTRTAPRSRARSAEPCTFIMETARRGNAACTINVGFLVSASTATSHSRPEQARSRWCSVVVYKVVRIVGVRPAAEGAAGTVGSDGRAGGSAVPVATSSGSRVWPAGRGGPPGPGSAPNRAAGAPLASRASRAAAFGGDRRRGLVRRFLRLRGQGCVYAETCRMDTPTSYLPPLAGRIRRTLGCVYAAPWGAYTHPPA